MHLVIELLQMIAAAVQEDYEDFRGSYNIEIRVDNTMVNNPNEWEVVLRMPRGTVYAHKTRRSVVIVC